MHPSPGHDDDDSPVVDLAHCVTRANVLDGRGPRCLAPRPAFWLSSRNSRSRRGLPSSRRRRSGTAAPTADCRARVHGSGWAGGARGPGARRVEKRMLASKKRSVVSPAVCAWRGVFDVWGEGILFVPLTLFTRTVFIATSGNEILGTIRVSW